MSFLSRVNNILLSPVEQAYLAHKEQFSKTKQRYVRYRLRKKLRLIEEQGCAAAATLQRLSPQEQTSGGFGTERSLIHEALPKEAERPSSSAWQSEGFVNLRSRDRSPPRALCFCCFSYIPFSCYCCIY